MTELTAEPCEAHAVGSELRAQKHTDDAKRSLELAEECRTEAALWRLRADRKRAEPAESPVAPSLSPGPGERATGDSAGSAATEEPRT